MTKRRVSTGAVLLLLGLLGPWSVASGAERNRLDPASFVREHGTVSLPEREIERAGNITVEFWSHGQHFHLHLWPDTSLFGAKVPRGQVMEAGGRVREVAIEASHYLTGHHRDYPDMSHVHAYYPTGDTMSGVVRMPDGERYYLEPADRYYEGHPNNTVIFRHSDLRYGPSFDK